MFVVAMLLESNILVLLRIYDSMIMIHAMLFINHKIISTNRLLAVVGPVIKMQKKQYEEPCKTTRS